MRRGDVNYDPLKGFFGDEQPEGKLVQTLAGDDNEPFMRPLSSEEQEELSLRVPDMNAKEARTATEAVKKNLLSAYSLIVEIRSRRGYIALNYKNWDSYCKAEFGMWGQTLSERIEAEKERRELIESVNYLQNPPLSTTFIEKMPDSQVRILNALDNPEEKIQAIQIAKEIRAEKPVPEGKAGLYYRKDKITADDLEAAIQRLKDNPLQILGLQETDTEAPSKPVQSPNARLFAEIQTVGYVSATPSSLIEDEPQAVTRYCQFVRAEKADGGIVLVTFYDPDSDTTGQVPVRRDCLP